MDVCVCVYVCAAPLGSFIGNRLSCRVTVVLGGLLSSAGLILSSFANSLEYLYLTLGVLTGKPFRTGLKQVTATSPWEFSHEDPYP